QLRDVLPAGEGEHFGQVEPRLRMPAEPGFEPAPAGAPRQRADIFAAVEQNIIDAYEGGQLGEMPRRRQLAVEALLQVVERGGIEVPPDQQLAVQHAIAEDVLDDVGERRRDVVAGAREQRYPPLRRDDLDADAVPFPLGGEVGGVEL